MAKLTPRDDLRPYAHRARQRRFTCRRSLARKRKLVGEVIRLKIHNTTAVVRAKHTHSVEIFSPLPGTISIKVIHRYVFRSSLTLAFVDSSHSVVTFDRWSLHQALRLQNSYRRVSSFPDHLLAPPSRARNSESVRCETNVSRIYVK